MHELHKEWVEKAEADFATAAREMAVPENANYDAVCFHAQQCIEKFMKALLLQQNQLAPKTHDLAYLERLLTQCGVSLDVPAEDLRFLSRAAVEYRYPGESATREDAARVTDICQQLRALLRTLLGLSH
jgi:HEPN domain-containing protein